jgi:hypothetical protein
MSRLFGPLALVLTVIPLSGRQGLRGLAELP